MTDNLDDFEQPGLEQNGNGLAPPPTGVRANLTHAWRTRPLFKLLVLMIIAGAIIVVGMSLFSSPKKNENSKFATPPTGVKSVPGGPTSSYFIEQTNKADTDRINNALQTGKDAMITPVGRDTSIDEMTAKNAKPDPLIELRQQLEQTRQKLNQVEQRQQPVQQKQAVPFDDSLAQAMQKQMKQLEDDWEPKGIKAMNGAKTDEDKKKETQTADGSTGSTVEGAEGGAYGSGSEMVMPRKKKYPLPIINAGTVSYAQLLTEANSDVPGPILAQIMSGPLTGARAVGDFKVENELLVLKFSLANLKGLDYKIDALALDPDTTLGGMATEVDERWVTRVLLPAAAGFVQGFGQALGQGSSSVVSNGNTTIVQQSGKGLQQGLFTGLGQAGQTLGQYFQNEANNTKPLIRVAAGTPIGMFFTSTVYDTSSPSLTGGYGNGGGNSGYGGYGSQQQSGYGNYGQIQSNGNGTNMPPNAFNNGQYSGINNAFGTSQPGYGNNAYNSASYGSSSNGQSTNSNVPYNTTNPPAPVYQQNYGYGGTPGFSGIGTTPISP